MLSRIYSLVPWLFIIANNILAVNVEQDQLLNSLADEYLNFLHQEMPEWTTEIKLENARNDLFNDHSLNGVERISAYQDKIYAELLKIKQSELSQESKITFHTFKQSLEGARDSRICKKDLWNLDSYYPWFMAMANLAQLQPVVTDKDMSDAIHRWKGFDVLVDAEIQKLRLGMEQGYTAPKAVLKGIIQQLDSLLLLPVKDSPFYIPNNGNVTAEFEQEFYRIVNDNIYPNLAKFREFLNDEYLPRSRIKPGVSSHKNGKACYKAMVKAITSKDMPPGEIYNLGMRTIQKLSDQLHEISVKHFNGISNKELLEYASNKSKPFESEQEVLDYNYAALDRVKAILPQLVNTVPKSDFVIKPYPEYRAKSGVAGEYHSPSRDGTLPGIFYINTYNHQNSAYVDLESTLYHEAIPGHHLQIALLIENQKIHPLTELLLNTSSVEGWALYAETLAYEFELFSEPLTQVGYISNMMFRAARLVVDPGLHYFNWNKQQAIAFMKQYTVLPDQIITSEVDRYLTWPAQATAYYIGMNDILQARSYAKQQQGESFSLQAFNDYVLLMSPAPLTYLEQGIKLWVTIKNKNNSRFDTKPALNTALHQK